MLLKFQNQSNFRQMETLLWLATRSAQPQFYLELHIL